jgi:hypothetical protein
MDQKFRLSPSTVASYFKHRCDRQFRWNSVEQTDRGRTGIGWNVPPAPRFHSRPGINLLMAAGDDFEIDRLEQLRRDYGPDQLFHNGLEAKGERQVVRPLPMNELAELLHRPSPPRFAAQIFIDLEATPAHATHFLGRFGLDPARVRVGTARPDLLEVVEIDGKRLLRVWDIKASQAARHEHFIQVAYYSFLLEDALRAYGLEDACHVDTQWGVIYSREGPDEFLLAPYRMAIEDFLRHRMMDLLQTEAAEAHYHVNEGCPMCQYLDNCRTEADAGRDLSRVAYLSSESKRRLVSHGIRTHRDLSRLSEGDPLWERLRGAGHNLSVNLGRYVAVAQALEDGRPRPLAGRSLTIPAWEDVRVILSAEQDPVTNTCFALGIKTLEGYDARKKPFGTERVFLLENPAAVPDAEARMLLAFLRVLNELLLRVDAENKGVAAELGMDSPEVAARRQALVAATAALADFKAAHPRLYKSRPGDLILLEERSQLEAAEKEADKALKAAEREAWYQNRRRQKRLHFYVYDGFDLTVLKHLVERHLFAGEPELMGELFTLVRLFPPESVLPDADTFRTLPGTVVVQALRQLVALPAPYIYDLRTVSERIPPDAHGREPFRFRPPAGFVFRGTNQVMFERIHDVWNGAGYLPNPRDPATFVDPAEVLRRVERSVINKLRATDAIVGWLKKEYRDKLLLRKEPFRLYENFDPLGYQSPEGERLFMLDALRVFTLLETSLDEMSVKHLHTLPVEDRVARFECISGLRYIEGADEPDGSLWFTFDPAARDVKFERGAFDLVLTPQDVPERLVSEIDGALFEPSKWKHEPYKVDLIDYDLTADPPRVCLRPKSKSFGEKVDLAAVHTLDKVFMDYNTGKVLHVLSSLGEAPDMARHVHELLNTAAIPGWRPLIDDVAGVESALSRQVDRGGKNPNFLTDAQKRAFRGVPAAPLSLIWGPPGTGKTYMLGHLLLAYILAARQTGRPVRILVTAFTHHAINNVLQKLAELLAAYQMDGPETSIVKIHGSHGPAADERLPAEVRRVPHKDLPGLMGGETTCLVAGSTVWGIYNGMKSAGSPVQPWFDVVLIDEASQMKLPDALIAFSSSKPDGAVILAGDDRQLPPIIHGEYPAEHEHMLSSVFAFMRSRIEERTATEPDFEARTIFQLEENFRMNEPLTAYPRDAIYNGHFHSQQTGIRIITRPQLPPASDEPVDFMLHPDRPVVLCRYDAPISFTARNPLEADIVARLILRLSEIMLKPGTDEIVDAEYLAAQGIAVLSPHRAQNSTIRGLLEQHGFGRNGRPMPLVDTVDKLQGQERDVVIVSYGVADEEYAEAEAEFLLSSHRFNVATTRPRRKLIVLCSNAVLDVVPQDRDILLESMLLKQFRNYCDSGPRLFDWKAAEFDPVALAVQWKSFEPQPAITVASDILSPSTQRS